MYLYIATYVMWTVSVLLTLVSPTKTDKPITNWFRWELAWSKCSGDENHSRPLGIDSRARASMWYEDVYKVG